MRIENGVVVTVAVVPHDEEEPEVEESAGGEQNVEADGTGAEAGNAENAENVQAENPDQNA